MTTTKFDNPWGNAGDLGDAITTAKQDSGFTNLDKPTYQRFNNLLNRSETKQNQIITEGPNGTYDNATDVGGMIATGLWDENWGVVDESGGKNLFGVGGSTGLKETHSYIDSNGVRMVLFLNTTGEQIHSLNTITEAFTTSGDLTTALSTPVGTWQLNSFITDGTYIYCLFRDSGDDSGRVQSFLISDWSANIAWPATGTGLTVGAIANINKSMCFANSTHIAIAQTAIVCVTSGSECLRLITIADGTAGIDGAGDCPTANGNKPTGQICSDGTNIFFGVDSGTTPVNATCSATIADLTAGTGGTGYPLTTSSPTVICSAGKKIFSALNDSNPAKTDLVVFVGDSSDCFIDAMSPGEDFKASTPNNIIYSGAAEILFDGSNIWILTNVNGNSIAQGALIKIDAAKFSGSDRSVNTYWRSLMETTNGANFLTDDTYLSATFDGRDIWATSNAGSGEIARFPLAMLRG